MLITQADFIDHLITQQIPIALFLTSGIKLLGYLLGYDDTTVLLEGQQRRQLIYKTSISTILSVEMLAEALPPARESIVNRSVA